MIPFTDLTIGIIFLFGKLGTCLILNFGITIRKNAWSKELSFVICSGLSDENNV